MASSQPLATVGLQLLLLIPWIQPLSAGPSRNTWPWLISAACLAGVLMLRRHWRPQAIAQAWLAAALISCTLALMQYFGWAAQFQPWIAPMGPGEGAANLRQRNQFASLTAIGLVALIYLFASARPRELAKHWLVAGLALALLAAGNASSGSRTGLLAWVLVLIGTLWFCGRKQRPAVALVAGGLALYLVLSTLLPLVLNQVLSTQGTASPCAAGACSAIERLSASGNDSRRELWRNVLTLIAQRPWTGWGWNELDYAHYITLFDEPRFTEKLDNAHNLPLHLAVELGIPLALLGLLGLAVVIWRSRPWSETQGWRQAAWGVLAVIGLHSLLEYPLWYGPFQSAVIICAICLWLTPRQPQLSPMWLARKPRRSIDVIALGLLTSSALVAYDYHRVSQVFLPPHQRHTGYREQPLKLAQETWLFRDHANFARLTLTPVRVDNAAEQLQLAQSLLHYSPEPVVIERLLSSAALLGDTEQLEMHEKRYRAAYPQQYAQWLQRRQ